MQEVINLEEPQILMMDCTEGFSVYVAYNGGTAWIDVWVTASGDVNTDWNKYIFFLTDPADEAQRLFQQDPDNYEAMTSAAVNHLEIIGKIHQNANGVWAQGPPLA